MLSSQYGVVDCRSSTSLPVTWDPLTCGFKCPNSVSSSYIMASRYGIRSWNAYALRSSGDNAKSWDSRRIIVLDSYSMLWKLMNSMVASHLFEKIGRYIYLLRGHTGSLVMTIPDYHLNVTYQSIPCRREPEVQAWFLEPHLINHAIWIAQKAATSLPSLEVRASRSNILPWDTPRLWI